MMDERRAYIPVITPYHTAFNNESHDHFFPQLLSRIVAK
jgi:hypothetical protein